MSSERDRQLQAARDIDRMSTAMIRFGSNIVKKNPIKVGSYLLGLVLCIFVSGYKLSNDQWTKYQGHIQTIDYNKLDSVESELRGAYNSYYRSKGTLS